MLYMCIHNLTFKFHRNQISSLKVGAPENSLFVLLLTELKVILKHIKTLTFSCLVSFKLGIPVESIRAYVCYHKFGIIPGKFELNV